MSSNADFWTRKLAGHSAQTKQQPVTPQPPPITGNSTPWWQAPPPPSMQPVTPLAGNTTLEGGITVDQLAQMDPHTLSQEALEVVARYKLGNPKYNNHCPYCRSTNYGLMSKSNDGYRCFDCGYSNRGSAARLDNQLQPPGKLGGNGKSQHIDGGQGSFNGKSYNHISAGARYEAMGQRPGI